MLGTGLELREDIGALNIELRRRRLAKSVKH